MRLLLIALLAANIGSYFWIQQTGGSATGPGDRLAFAGDNKQNHSTPRTAPNTEVAVATIKLLHEPEPALQPAIADATSIEPTPQPQKSANTLQSDGARTESAQAGQSTLADASVIADIAKRVAALKDKVDAPRDDARAENAIASPSLESLKDDLTLAQADSAQLALSGPEGSLCWFVDVQPEEAANRASAAAIKKDTGLTAIADYIASVGIQAELVEVKVPKRLKYIVYVPQLESKSAALVRLRELLADGYDAFVFREGAYKNAISLGFYSNKAIAAQMHEKFSSEGLEVELAPWESFKLDSRLRLDHENSSKLASGLWAAIEDRWDGALREKKYCDAIAQR